MKTGSALGLWQLFRSAVAAVMRHRQVWANVREPEGNVKPLKPRACISANEDDVGIQSRLLSVTWLVQ